MIGSVYTLSYLLNSITVVMTRVTLKGFKGHRRKSPKSHKTTTPIGRLSYDSLLES